MTSKELIEKTLKNVFVNLHNPNERKPFEEIKNTNSVVLMIDWEHKPCIKTLNRLKEAMKSWESDNPTR